MAGKITFKFVDLAYQIDAVNSVVDLFSGQNKTTGESLYKTPGRSELFETRL